MIQTVWHSNVITESEISFETYLSHDIASVSDITPCNKIDKPLQVYRFSNIQ